MTKKGMAQKIPPPPPNELSLRFFLGDTSSPTAKVEFSLPSNHSKLILSKHTEQNDRDLILQLGVKKNIVCPLVVPGSAIF